jgi:signal recognition particle receptor subunit beta
VWQLFSCARSDGLFAAVWKHYYNGTIAVIFVVDSSDAERFAEARTELEQMGQDPELRDWTLLVLANKVDLPAAASVSEVTEALGLAALKGPLAWHVQGCCALKKEGIQEGFTWLAETLKKQNKN